MSGGRVVGIVALGDLALEQDRDSALADVSAAPPKVGPSNRRSSVSIACRAARARTRSSSSRCWRRSSSRWRLRIRQHRAEQTVCRPRRNLARRDLGGWHRLDVGAEPGREVGGQGRRDVSVDLDTGGRGDGEQ